MRKGSDEGMVTRRGSAEASDAAPAHKRPEKGGRGKLSASFIRGSSTRHRGPSSARQSPSLSLSPTKRLLRRALLSAVVDGVRVLLCGHLNCAPDSSQLQ